MRSYSYFKELSIFIVAFIALLTSNTINAQNTYLSFADGEKQLVSQNTLPVRHVKNFFEQGVEIQFEFPGAIVSEKEAKGDVYNYLHLDGIHKMGQVGAPALPAKNEVIAMPKGSQGKIVILEAEYEEYDGYNIHPALEPARDTEGAPEPQFQKDDAIYSKDEFFPKKIVEVADVFFNRDVPLALTQIVPVQFNPVTKKIRVYTNIRFKVQFIGGVGSFDYIAEDNSKHFTDLLKRNVINSQSIPDGIPNNQVEAKNGAKNYIIITHSQYNTQANQLADWKRQLGYSVEVVSQASWTATQVKSEISTRYHSWTPKPDYFVIIGDHDGSYAVPAEIHQTNDNPPEDFATDLYFACMDGSGDWHPDMAHGRISVSNSSEAQVVVDKIIDYEKNPTTTSSFYQNGLNCAQYQDDDNNGYADRRFCHTSEDIRDYLQNDHGYSAERVYYTSSTAPVSTLKYNNDYYSNGSLLPAELRDASFDWNGGASDITSAINSGKFYVFHRDHGYVGGSGWAHPYYTTSSMTSLSNGDLLPVVFSINCHTGEFQLSNCFAEKFTRMSGKGAVGVIGAAYYSLSGYNDALAIGMVDAIWATPGVYPVMGSAGSGANYTIGDGNEIYTMGDVMNQGLYAMEQNVSWSNSRQYEYELFHWFGDPAMKIWTDNPNNTVITATHASTIDVANSTFNISNSTSGATATILFNNTLIGETVLDASGNGDIPYSITETGATATLTISKHNCKPYESTLTVTGSGSFPPSMTTQAASNITENTASLNGEIVDDQGEAVTESGFVYSTSPDPVIGGTGVVQVQTTPTVTSGTYSLDITGLQSNTAYYYKAYAINANGTGYGDETSFTTLCGVISTFPMNEGFESGTLPDCWSYDGTAWAFQNGGYSGHPGSAHTGSYNAIFYHSSSTADVSKLISPPLDFSSSSNATLNFWHTQAAWSGDQDELRIYYKTFAGDSWTLLAEYTNDITAWTERSISLPSLSSDYYIAFEATGQYGYGVVIDDIEISVTSLPAPENLVATVSNTTDVNLVWNKPAGAGGGGTNYGTPAWYSHIQMADITNLNWPTPERGTLFDNADFSFTYPAQINKISHGFYEDSSYPWPDATFHFKIYAADGTTLLYESGDIEAVHYTEIEHTLPTPLEVSGDFYVMVAPIDASGHPSSLSKSVTPGTTHSYSGSAGNWSIYDDGTDAYEFMNRVYLAVEQTKEEVAISYEDNSSIKKESSNGLVDHKYIADIEKDQWTTPGLVKDGAKATLSGFKVYRTGASSATYTINNPDDTIYSDAGLAGGTYDYYVTAVYTSPDGESDASNTETVVISSAPVATISATPGCNTGSITVTSDLLGTQTFYLCNDGGATLSSWTGNATNHEFTGQTDGIYRGKVEKDGLMSALSNPVTLTNETAPAAPSSVSATNLTICNGETSELTYSGGSGNTFAWFTSSCGGTQVGTGNNLSVAPTSTTTYYGRWENSCGNSSCLSVTITVNPLPQAPASVSATSPTICTGETTQLTYSGGSGDNFYWYTSSCGGTLVGSGNNLSITPTATTTYYGRWENNCGSSTCESTVVTVNPLTAITSQPQSATICEAENVEFTVAANGTNLTYQWYKDGSLISGAASTSYNIYGASPADEGDYTCEVTGDCGTETSNPATLTVDPLPVAPTAVSATPASICEGETTQLSYSGGSGDSFAWYTSSCGGTLVGTGNDLSVNPTTTSTYYGRWENSCGNSDCETVEVVVNPLTVIATHPQSNSVCEGDNVEFSIVADGTNLTYQWYKDGSSISGATSSSYSISPVVLNDEGDYTCEVTGDCGTEMSDAASLSVDPATEIAEHPTDIEALEGEEVTFSVTAQGVNLAYQWRFEGSYITGETSATCIIDAVTQDDEGMYDVVVTGDCGELTSNEAELNVLVAVAEMAGKGMNIYPNPAEKSVYLDLPKEFNNYTVVIFGSKGEIVWQNNFVYNGENNRRINLSGLNAGVYHLKVFTDKLYHIEKLIIR